MQNGNVWQKSTEHSWRVLQKKTFLLGKLQCDDAFRLSFHTLAPELEFGIDGSMKNKVLLQALSMKGADWRVVAHLLWYEPEAQILSGTMERTARIKVEC